jgi:hypothetical protein
MLPQRDRTGITTDSTKLLMDVGTQEARLPVDWLRPELAILEQMLCASAGWPSSHRSERSNVTFFTGLPVQPTTESFSSEVLVLARLDFFIVKLYVSSAAER